MDDNKNKIEIKHSAFLVLPIIAGTISIFGAWICFQEGFPASGRSWMPIFLLLTIFIIPIFAIICCLIGGLICIFIDKVNKPKICINKFWIPILIIAISSPFWSPFTISPALFMLGGKINDFIEGQKYNHPTQVAPQEPIRPKREYYCESKVTQDGIVKFCTGNPEDQ